MHRKDSHLWHRRPIKQGTGQIKNHRGLAGCCFKSRSRSSETHFLFHGSDECEQIKSRRDMFVYKNATFNETSLTC